MLCAVLILMVTVLPSSQFDVPERMVRLEQRSRLINCRGWRLPTSLLAHYCHRVLMQCAQRRSPPPLQAKVVCNFQAVRLASGCVCLALT